MLITGVNMNGMAIISVYLKNFSFCTNGKTIGKLILYTYIIEYLPVRYHFFFKDGLLQIFGQLVLP